VIVSRAAGLKECALIVYSLSQLARSTKDTINISERLAKSGAGLVSLSEKIDTTSAAGKIVIQTVWATGNPLTRTALCDRFTGRNVQPLRT